MFCAPEPRSPSNSSKVVSGVLSDTHGRVFRRFPSCCPQRISISRCETVHVGRFENASAGTTHCVEINSFLQYKKYLPIDNLMLCCRSYANRSQADGLRGNPGNRGAKSTARTTPTFLGSGSMRTVNLCSTSIPSSKEQTRPNEFTKQLIESNAEL